ncbi:MAG: polysaccharide deacetylase family protein [Bacillaceae bacterium]
MRRRLRRGIKSALVVLAVAVIVFIGYAGITKVVAKDQQVLTEPTMVTTLPTEHKGKVAPTHYNGEVRKVAYLTIDDGPSKHTDKLLQILKEKDVKATFFLIGTNVELYKEAVKASYDQGHYVGMHSVTHDYNKLYTNGEIVNEMKETQRRIAAITGHESVLYRCPYGTNPGLNQNLRDKTVQAGLKTWDWTIDSFDWEYQKNPSQIVENIKKQLTAPLEVILIHDKPGTIEALPQIIDVVREQGYEFEVYDENKHFPLNFMKDDRI